MKTAPGQGGRIVKDHRQKNLLILNLHGWIREKELRPLYDIVESRWDGDHKIRSIRFDLTHLLILEDRAIDLLQKMGALAMDNQIHLAFRNVPLDVQSALLERSLDEILNVELDPELEKNFRNAAARGDGTGKNRWILIIDDSTFFRKKLAALLQAEGFTVREADNSAEGYNLLKSLPFHLVILDLLLPDLSGFMTAELIRADQVLETMPIIFATAQENAEPRERATELGQGFYLKTEPVENLLSLIHEVLGQSASDAGEPPISPETVVASDNAEVELREERPSRILIVDDSGFIRRQTSLILDGAGFETRCAATGPDGLDIAAAETVDLILLDLNLPDFDGLDTLRALKSRIETRDIPVVIFSVRREREMIIRALDHGAVNYLLKPFEAAELLDRIRKCIVKPQLSEAAR